MTRVGPAFPARMDARSALSDDPQAPVMIAFEAVNKWFGDFHVLKDISLTVRPVELGDDSSSLAARIFSAECELYPRVLREVASGERALPGLDR